MKTLKLILKIAALCILAAAFFFGLFAFIYMSLDPGVWDLEIRFLVAFLTFITTLIIIVSHLKFNKW